MIDVDPALPACALRTARRAGSHCQWAQPTFDNWELSSKLQVLCSDEGYSCPAACTRPVPARPEGAPPTRVRRGVHTLSAAEWARVTDALWVMRHLPDAQGRKLYGPGYAKPVQKDGSCVASASCCRTPTPAWDR